MIVAVGFVAALMSFGCSKGEGKEERAAKTGAATGDGLGRGTDTAASKDGAGGSASVSREGGGGAGRGGRRVLSITLAATDVRTVERGLIEGGPAVSGDLRPVEEVNIKSRLEGNLVGLYVREGDHVSSGQLLARFESSEQEGNRRSAEADVASAKSDLVTAQWNADQAQELFKAGAIAERDFRTAQQTAEAAKARLAASEARLQTAI